MKLPRSMRRLEMRHKALDLSIDRVTEALDLDDGGSRCRINDVIGRATSGGEKVSPDSAPDVTDPRLPRVDRVLHVARAVYKGHDNTLRVRAARVHALLERGARYRADVRAPVVVAALDSEIAVGLGIVLVVLAGQRMSCFWDKHGGSRGSSADSLGGPDGAVGAQLSQSFLEVAASVHESERCKSASVEPALGRKVTHETSTHCWLAAQVSMHSAKETELTASKSLPP